MIQMKEILQLQTSSLCESNILITDPKIIITLKDPYSVAFSVASHHFYDRLDDIQSLTQEFSERGEWRPSQRLWQWNVAGISCNTLAHIPGLQTPRIE